MRTNNPETRNPDFLLRKLYVTTNLQLRKINVNKQTYSRFLNRSCELVTYLEYGDFFLFDTINSN